MSKLSIYVKELFNINNHVKKDLIGTETKRTRKKQKIQKKKKMHATFQRLRSTTSTGN